MNTSSVPAGTYARFLTTLWLVAVVAAAAYIWIAGGWFHLEVLPPFENAKSRGLLSLFDWQVFDAHPARLRLLSNLTEVIDGMLRPRTAWLFGHHPSLTLSMVAMAYFSAYFFFRALLFAGLSRNEAVMFTALFISTIGFLSCFVPYVRPAKRLALLALCALLFLVLSYRKLESDRTLAWLYVVLLMAFLSDEAGYVYWVVVLLFLVPKLRGIRLSGYFAVPLTYLVLAKVLLPPLYDLLGKSGPREGAIAASVVTKLLKSMLSLDFPSLALEDLGRAMGTTVGLLSMPLWIPVTVLAATAIYAYSRKSWIVFILSISLAGTSLFLSMLDLVNTTRSFIGQLTYYYHNALAVLTVFWLASLYHWFRPSSQRWRIAAGFGLAIISILNLANFSRINELIRILHTYPIASFNPTILDPEKMARRHELLLDAGPLPQAEGLRAQFANYRREPMVDISYAERLERTFERRRRNPQNGGRR